MPPRQGKAGHVVVKLGNFPRPIAVALLALASGLAVVLVILLVAAKAIRSGVAKTLQIFVARRALHRQRSVRVAQRKLGAIVLKPAVRILPVPLGVAVCTIFPEVVLVLVIFLVTAVAIFGCLLKQGALVTRLTRCFGVFSQQRKAGGAMVKFGGLLPTALAVAATAVFAQSLLVFVVLFVAGVAVLA